MAAKHLVCDGAVCKCQFGTMPDKLKVLTQRLRYVNDGGRQKLLATHMELGPTFEKNSFGTCAVTNGGPCAPVVTRWDGSYQNVTLEDNGGHALLEDSTATCAVSGTPSIRILLHGQTASVGAAALKRANKAFHAAVNPAVDIRQLEDDVDDTPEVY